MRSKLAHNILAVSQKELLFEKNDRIIVAVSGGIDSTALLHLLVELDLNLQLYAVYIDHQLRPEEVPFEIKHVKREAEKLGVIFLCREIDTIRHQQKYKLSQEEAARILRYKTLETIREEVKAQYIAVGHTSDDQVEEFFLRLIRGSGKCGLSGMLFKQGQIIRPLLGISKKELNSYLQEKHVSFCEDSSNSKRIYTRNRVRLDLLPLLETFNPSIRKTILNTSTILQEEEDLLQALCGEQYNNCVKHQNSETIELNLNSFKTLHSALKRRILEKVFWAIDNRPTYTNIDTILLFIDKSVNNKTLTLDGGLRVTKLEKTLNFHFPFGKNSTSRQKLAITPELDVTIKATGSYKVSSLKQNLDLNVSTNQRAKQYLNSLAVDFERLTFPLTLRYHMDGERFKPVNCEGSKKINRFLTEKKISTEKRKFHPLLVNADGEIISVLGLAVSDFFKITNSTQKMMTIDWDKY